MKRIAVIVLLAIHILVSAWAIPQRHRVYPLMLDAAKAMRAAETTLYDHKSELGLVEATNDPLHTGLIGVEYSRITTTIGSLKAKRTATNPDFAAYIVRELSDHGLGIGDSILVTMTGSFPGMNLAVLSALDELKTSTLRIVSLGASSYGANQEDWTWIDIEDLLVREGKLSTRSNVVSLGGGGDIGGGMTKGARSFLKRKAERLGYPIIAARTSKKQARLRRSLIGSIQNYKLVINVGGNQAMLGNGPQGRALPGGWIPPNLNPWRNEHDDDINGIIFESLNAGVPVLNLLHIEDIATAANLPVDSTFFAEPGTAPLYFNSTPRP
jgi:poly-gamma-glutamate system protein